MNTTERLSELLRTFVAPPRLSHSRPRAVALKPAGRALVAVALLLFTVAIGVAVVFPAQVRRDARNRQALLDSGVMTSGGVTRLWSNGDDKRRVRYRFVVDGRVYEGDARVSAQRRTTLDIGTPIPVRYVPGDPNVNDLGGTPRSTLPIGVPFVIAAAVAAFGVICLLAVNYQRQLLIEGRAAPAIVTDIKKRHTSHGGTHRSIRYQFPLLSGATGAGKASASNKLPAIGSVICVVYDPDRPTRSMVYPFALVAPAK